MSTTPKGSRKVDSSERVLRRRFVRSNIENIPTRNLTKKYNVKENSSPSKMRKTGDNSAQKITVDSDIEDDDAGETIFDSPQKSVLSESRYNLRNRSIDTSQSRILYHQTILYKTILTPTRIKLQQSKNRKSLYRTPQIVTEVENFRENKNKTILKEQKAKWREEIDGLLNKNWKTSYLSTTINFKYRMKNLKKSYEAALKVRIIDVYPAYEISVTIKPTSLLNQNPKEVDGVFFTVTALQPQLNEGEDKLSIIYEAFLIKTNQIQSDKIAGFEWFPLILHRGAEIIHQTFISWFQSSFGCYITPRHLPQGCMLWLAGIWSNVKCNKMNHPKESDSRIIFQYIIRPTLKHMKFKPPNDKRKIFVKASCFHSDIREVWNRIREDEKNLTSLEEIIRFHNVMGDFMENLSHLPKSLLHISQVKTSCMTLVVDGMIRLTCASKFASVLKHLIEIFLETCHVKCIDYKPVDLDENLDDEENLEN